MTGLLRFLYWVCRLFERGRVAALDENGDTRWRPAEYMSEAWVDEQRKAR